MPVLSNIVDACNFDTASLGQLASDLKKLATHDVRVLATAVLTADVFKEFLETSILPPFHADHLADIVTTGAFKRSNEIILRVSVSKSFDGLEDGVRVRKSRQSLKHAIERVYRSWSSDRARASRISQSLADEACMPAILVQPAPKRLGSFGTRDPVSGGLTTAENFRSPPDAELPEFKKQYGHLAEQVDGILCRPVDLFILPDKRGIPIAYVEDELMNVSAFFVALSDYLSAARIDEVEYLRRLDPTMLGQLISYRADSTAAPSVTGLPGSPGMTRGKLVFRGFSLDAHTTERYVCLLDEYFPEDIHLLHACGGGHCLARGHD